MPETAMTTIASTDAALTLVSTGAYSDHTGSSCTIYPPGYTWWPWMDSHHHHYHPWPATPLCTPVGGGSEKPHEAVQRAIREIAEAARELVRAAEGLGVRVDGDALEEALVEKLRAAL